MDTTHIRTAAAVQRVSMKDLAKAANISPTSLWRKMNGKSEFKVVELKKIEAFLNIGGQTK